MCPTRRWGVKDGLWTCLGSDRRHKVRTLRRCRSVSFVDTCAHTASQMKTTLQTTSKETASYTNVARLLPPLGPR